MRSARIKFPHSIEIFEQSLPAPSADEVQVIVDLAGVCATDVHIFEGEFPKAKFPLVIGHEFTGIVGLVGKEVLELKAGDRVAIDPAVPCEKCRECLRARRNLCEDRKAYGINLPGGMSELVNIRAKNCYRLSNEIPAAAAVLTEPLACVIHAFERAGGISGQRVLVLGAGAIGLLATQVALERGAASVDQVDLSENRLGAAVTVGATEVGLGIQKLSRHSWDLVVDATGALSAIQAGVDALARGGTLLQIGVSEPSGSIAISPFRIFADELRIIGSLTTEGNFVEAVELIQSGRIRHEVITGAPLSFDQLSEALSNPTMAKSPKVVVRPR